MTGMMLMAAAHAAKGASAPWFMPFGLGGLIGFAGGVLAHAKIVHGGG